MYRFLFKKYTHENEDERFQSNYLSYVKETLNNLGLSGIWDNQANIPLSAEAFKMQVKRRLMDQFIQSWANEVNVKESCYNYRLYKERFQTEKYFELLPDRLLFPLIKFRTLNHRLPIQTGRWRNTPRNERLCTKCDLNDLGDEFHYILKCPFFCNQRAKYVPLKYWKYPNVLNFQALFGTPNKKLLSNIAYFVKDIMKAFKE